MGTRDPEDRNLAWLELGRSERGIPEIGTWLDGPLLRSELKQRRSELGMAKIGTLHRGVTEDRNSGFQRLGLGPGRSELGIGKDRNSADRRSELGIAKIGTWPGCDPEDRNFAV
jgi:hypothetical protein